MKEIRIGLTPEGYRAVKEIVDKDEPPWPDWSHEQWTEYVKGNVPRIKRTWSLKNLRSGSRTTLQVMNERKPTLGTK